MLDNKFIIIFMILLLLLFIIFQYYIFVSKYVDFYLHKTLNNIQSQYLKNQINMNIQTKKHYIDPIKQYDYKKLEDPLEEPTNRVDRYLLGSIEKRKMFNYPVRGYPDNPRWMGLLIEIETETTETTNKIIKLFGRQKYPSSNQYEYYTMINNGYDQIKISLDRKKEFYDDDEIFIPELNKKYKIKLNKNDDNLYF